MNTCRALEAMFYVGLHPRSAVDHMASENLSHGKAFPNRGRGIVAEKERTRLCFTLVSLVSCPDGCLI